MRAVKQAFMWVAVVLAILALSPIVALDRWLGRRERSKHL